MTPEQLRKKALTMGAEVEIEGERFNTARQKLKTKTPPAPKTVAPLPISPPPQYLTRQEVQTMLNDLDEAWAQRMDILLATLQKPASASRGSVITFQYARDGSIAGATTTPKD